MVVVVVSADIWFGGDFVLVVELAVFVASRVWWLGVFAVW